MLQQTLFGHDVEGNPQAKAGVMPHLIRSRSNVMVAIGCGSIHMTNSVPGFATRRVRQTRRLATQYPWTISTNGMSLRRARHGSGDPMPIEHASVRAMHKPWGVRDLQPWSSIDGTGDAVGELWFERADKQCSDSCLASQVAVHQRAVVDPGPSGRYVCARDGDAERQERSMVHHLGGTGRADRRRSEPAGHTTGIARGDREWLDR